MISDHTVEMLYKEALYRSRGLLRLGLSHRSCWVMIQNTIELIERIINNVSLGAPSRSASCQIVFVTSPKAPVAIAAAIALLNPKTSRQGRFARSMPANNRPRPRRVAK